LLNVEVMKLMTQCQSCFGSGSIVPAQTGACCLWSCCLQSQHCWTANRHLCFCVCTIALRCVQKYPCICIILCVSICVTVPIYVLVLLYIYFSHAPVLNTALYEYCHLVVS